MQDNRSSSLLLFHLSFAEFLLHAEIEEENLLAANRMARRCCKYIYASILLKDGPWSVTNTNFQGRHALKQNACLETDSTVSESRYT
jgi:hypothetical protein